MTISDVFLKMLTIEFMEFIIVLSSNGIPKFSLEINIINGIIHIYQNKVIR